MREAGERGDAAAVAALEVRLWLDGPAAAEGRVQGEARALALDMSATVLRHGLADEAGQSDLVAWDRLEEIAVPATLSWGDLDVPDVIAVSATLAERLPDVRGVHVFAGTAHLPYLERPAEVADWITRA
jgi:pimeloyl-ACP methyl ester carboxylesterase